MRAVLSSCLGVPHSGWNESGVGTVYPAPKVLLIAPPADSVLYVVAKGGTPKAALPAGRPNPRTHVISGATPLSNRTLRPKSRWRRAQVWRREARTFFYSPPNSPLRKAVLDVMLQFAKRIKIDRPKDLATERLEAAIARYHSNAITTVQVLEELIQLAKDMRAARERGEEQGLNPEEVAFYDALAENNSAREMMGDEKLRVIAHELVMGLKSSTTVVGCTAKARAPGCGFW